MKKLRKRIKDKRIILKAFPSGVFLSVITLCFFIVLASAFYYTMQGKMSPKYPAVKALAQERVPLSITSTPSPTATPSPTLAPKPSYSGFCLNVPVLMYHHIDLWGHARQAGHTALTVDAGVFDQQMGYLKAQGYTFYFAEDLANALRAHSSLAGKPIVVTIDDGYDDVYTYAFSTIKKYGIKATLFIPTGLLGVSAGTNNYYTWDQTREMIGSGLFMAENHTFSHFPMGTKDVLKDQYEINTAEQEIQQNLGRHSNVFAYPYGTNATSPRVQSELAQAGFTAAFSTIGGTYQCDSFIYALHRTRIGSINFPAFGIF